MFEATGNVVTPSRSIRVLAGMTVLLALGALYVGLPVYANRAVAQDLPRSAGAVLGVFFEGFETAW